MARYFHRGMDVAYLAKKTSALKAKINFFTKSRH